MPKRPQRKIIGSRLIELMKQHRLRDAALAREIRVSPSQIKRWKNDEQGAMPDAVRALANFFDVSEAYLYGLDTADVREQLALEVARALGSPEADVLRAFGALSESRRYQLAGYILGKIEAEVSAPMAERSAPSSVSMVRRDGAARPVGDAAARGASVQPVTNDVRHRPAKP
jgi:transcriptional regulator with XRE-family HTH domain